MRVLIINTAERIGGAAIAANRLMEALKNNGIKTKFLVRDKQTDQVTVVALTKSWRRIWQFAWERAVIWAANGFKRKNLFAVDIANTGTDITSLPEFRQADVIHLHWVNQGMLSLNDIRRFKRKNLFAVDIANTGTDITSLPEFRQADVIHLHWVNQGMLSLNDIRRIIRSGKPVVWTMHDMWPFTGICHYAGSCKKYTQQCQSCELLQRPHKRDLSHTVFQKKTRLYAGSKLTFVACSHWLEEMAKQSALLQGQAITSIPNAINTNLFKPRPKKFAREKLNLPSDKKLLLFGSMKITDKRKGISYLIEACKQIADHDPELGQNLGVVVLGSHAEQYASLFPFPIYTMNYVSNEKELVDIYNAVDL